MIAHSRVLRSLAVVALSTALVAACGSGDGPGGRAAVPIGGESGSELAERQVLRRGNGAEPQSLDPHKSEGVPESNLQRDLYEGLTSSGADGEIVPGVAESWEVSEDGLVYTFHLRDNARWSNGDPVTAADFEYSLRRSVDPATLSNYGIILHPIENAAAVIAGERPPEDLGVRALDPRTLEITLGDPTPYFLGVLAHSAAFPVHRATVETYGDRWARPGRLVSNGAFQLADWVVQSHIQLLRNPHYWDADNVRLEEVWYYPIENQSTELQRYRANELDMTYDLPFRQLRWIRDNLPDELVISDYLGVYYYGLNVTRQPFLDNPALRQALYLAINRERLTSQITGAGEIPAYGYVPAVQGYVQQTPEWATWTQAEREAEARQLYAEAGYSTEEPLRLQILYNTHENHRTIAVAISSMWNEVLGIQTELVNEEWKVYLETRRSKQTTQVFRAGWIGDYNDAFSFAELMHSTSAMNDSGWEHAPYDELLARAAAERDPAQRAEYLQAAERELLREMPLIPIYFYVTKRVVKPWVGGYRPHIQDYIYSRDLYILKH
ncbi:MAG: peptide ABC transporter substrate-binding protein [Gammaproteobacteria bacterium]|nr:peptide ABC transporter substrate-binding protein [Gammaproteobacteria bacterium]TVQ47780.1 MAG: peptide ABC transporter substrate-binding protein [Gammaproteobacteria bacterium]